MEPYTLNISSKFGYLVYTPSTVAVCVAVCCSVLQRVVVCCIEPCTLKWHVELRTWFVCSALAPATPARTRIHPHMYTIHPHMYTHTHEHAHPCARTRTCTNTRAHKPTSTHQHPHTQTHTRVRTHKIPHAHTLTYMDTHTHTHTFAKTFQLHGILL